MIFVTTSECSPLSGMQIVWVCMCQVVGGALSSAPDLTTPSRWICRIMQPRWSHH